MRYSPAFLGDDGRVQPSRAVAPRVGWWVPGFRGALEALAGVLWAPHAGSVAGTRVWSCLPPANLTRFPGSVLITRCGCPACSPRCGLGRDFLSLRTFQGEAPFVPPQVRPPRHRVSPFPESRTSPFPAGSPSRLLLGSPGGLGSSGSNVGAPGTQAATPQAP